MEVLDSIHVVIAAFFGIAFVFVLACVVYFNAFEKEGKENSPSGCMVKFILSVIIVLAFFFILSMCGDSGEDWKPRHT